MNRSDFLSVIRNSKTKKEIKKFLGLPDNGYGTEKIIKMCYDFNISFEEEYSADVKKYNDCKECGKKIKLNKKFCNSSCAAKCNNKNRSVSNETKRKISESLKNNYKEGYINPNKASKLVGKSVKTSKNFDPIQKNYKYSCSYCGEEYRLNIYPSKARKTCSRECMIKLIFNDRKYNNGSRKTFYYYNKFINKNVILESSWEVKLAEFLDFKNIYWIRPDSLGWIDKNNKTRQYYPDFYLKDYDMYLDPKNEYCMDLDREKMSYIERFYTIEYGDVDEIIKSIKKLL